ncbi:hypothetical protein C0584_01410 [Candidatus Parcubacteria bacterium]|nr:MAG: hypothetical protein C0584_01410 [Candidatus Parcubacteria bacterium]
MKNLFFQKRIFAGALIVLTLFGLLAFQKPAFSLEILVRDNETIVGQYEQSAYDKAVQAMKEAADKLVAGLKTAGSKALSSSLRAALNTIAYDTATYLGSGNRGQKPLFITEGWGEYMNNIADNAAGSFIEDLGRNPDFFGQFNLCEPDLAVKFNIGLGLRQQYRPSEPVCTFSEMKENWDEELSRGDFLERFSTSFSPTSNEAMIAVSLHTNIVQDIKGSTEAAEKDREETGGWLDVRNIAGDRVSPPSEAERELEMAIEMQNAQLGAWTGDALVDASNVFLNQLAITAFQTAMRSLADGENTNFTSPYDWASLTDFEAGPASQGVSGTQGKLSGVIQPNFSIRGDYNILSELTMCPDPTKAGPTECVITDKFNQAILNKLTLAEAVRQGYLSGDLVFGFRDGGVEPRYNEGLPYRSMIILRKFRIIPVTWEIIAQHITKNFNRAYSLQELINCYDSNDEFGEPADTLNWCEGMIDPSWVLKAPLNYCGREGPGPNIRFETITGEGDDSKVNISRDDKYCGDEQTCIDENSDGSCNVYGYCTEEKRKWVFGSEACEPKFNTCQTFKKSDGSTISFLENTVDSFSCSLDNAGCSEYFTQADSVDPYDENTNNVFWSTAVGDPHINLDRDAEECSEKNEGCTQLIRTKEGTGVNILPNASFEDTDVSGNLVYWSGLGTLSTEAFDGYSSLELSPGYSSILIPVGPFGYLAAGEEFSLSFYAKDCTDGTIVGFDESIIPGAEIATSSVSEGAQWRRFGVSRYYKPDYFTNDVEIFFDVPAGGTCLIDAIKLERGGASTQYSGYMDEGIIYEKLIPEYLYEDCYQDAFATVPNYELEASRPAECDTYARLCMQEEVGCNMFTSLSDNMQVPAKVTAQDYCPDVCVGYDSYIQTKTSFDSEQEQLFIPNTAESCSAKNAGCDEFTNLDKTEEGGEAREYYKSLKQCIKPGDPAADCGDYYTWEGAEATGFQLKTFSLQRGVGTTSPATASGVYNPFTCNALIYAASSTSPLYNPDCREYYAKTGDVYYLLNSETITCSDNCHPYRRTEDNVVKNNGVNVNSATCSSLPGYSASPTTVGWDGDNNYCVECINGGVWNPQHNACIYMAIPNEGESCTASDAGCREYGGNYGNNVRIILNNDFEGSVQGWDSEGSTNASVSNESLRIGENSLFVQSAPNTISYNVGYRVVEGSAYVIRFLAKSTTDLVDLDIYFENSLASTTHFSEILQVSPGEWGIYEVNLLSLNHRVDFAEKLVIAGSGAGATDFYIDDIKLTNIRDKYYIIKNSWAMPEINGRDICNWDILADSLYPQYSLGCEQYSDNDNKVYSLRDFTKLCQESAVGCEIMIDTQNSDSYEAQLLPEGAITPKVNVPADEYVYAVYSEDKLCESADEGCQRMGKAYTYEGQKLTQDFYIKNNPDKYDTSVCSEFAVGCEEWTTNNGSATFKDPYNQVCEWRQESGGSAWAWLKKKIKRCDMEALPTDPGYGIIDTVSAGETTICFDDSDCSGGRCIVDETDYDCAVSQYKTIGFGGAGNAVKQPMSDADGNWVGVCSVSNSGCSEYIDPVSDFQSNKLFNANFYQDIDSDGYADGWDPVGPSGGSQEILLESNTLYVISVEGDNTLTVTAPIVAPAAVPPSAFRILNNSNEFEPNTSVVTVTSADDDINSVRFYIDGSYTVKVEIADASSHLYGNNSVVSVKKVSIDYQKEDLVDRESCNGTVDFEKGCVLFNERVVDGQGYEDLSWEADETIHDGSGMSPLPGGAGLQNANVLLKVSPDRTCGSWLACSDYVTDDDNNVVCQDIGLCDGLDDNGNCSNFLVEEAVQNSYTLPASIDFSNISGYAKYGLQTPPEEGMEGIYPFGKMEQATELAFMPNGDFEMNADGTMPFGWNSGPELWSENIFKVVDNPVEAEGEGVDRAPSGQSFLQVGGSTAYKVYSEYIDVIGGMEYSLTAYMNTINLPDGAAAIWWDEIDSNGALTFFDRLLVSSEYGNDWEKLTGTVQVEDATTQIKLKIGVTTAGSGSFYVDDVKIRPTLNSKPGTYVDQTCRLYPQDDSLSCEYIEDSGAKQKGWWGYCLEYDRAPGDPGACLQWWPVANIKGDGVSEGGSNYEGRYPLYYCTQTMVEPLYEYRHTYTLYRSGCHTNFLWWSSGNACNGLECPDGYIEYSHKGDDCSDTFDIEERVYCSCRPDGVGLVAGLEDGSPNSYSNYQVYPSSANDGWYIATADQTNYNTPAEITAANPNYELFCGTGSDPCYLEGEVRKLRYGDYIDYYAGDEIIPEPMCIKFAKTVTETGKNKYWSGRVFEGSDFQIPCYDGLMSAPTPICTQDSDYAPFGSAVYPEPVENPALWDSDDYMTGVQPMHYQDPNTNLAEPYQNRMGKLYTEDDIRRLFAQSYGVWDWSSPTTFTPTSTTPGEYIVSYTGHWEAPKNECTGPLGQRPPTPTDPTAPPIDLCGVIPRVDSDLNDANGNDIRVSGNTGDIYVSRNGFVELTFNTLMDSEQWPLVFYAIDWGDGKSTVKSGT